MAHTPSDSAVQLWLKGENATLAKSITDRVRCLIVNVFPAQLSTNSKLVEACESAIKSLECDIRSEEESYTSSLRMAADMDHGRYTTASLRVVLLELQLEQLQRSVKPGSQPGAIDSSTHVQMGGHEQASSLHPSDQNGSSMNQLCLVSDRRPSPEPIPEAHPVVFTDCTLRLDAFLLR
jgi:hypothetical protein